MKSLSDYTSAKQPLTQTQLTARAYHARNKDVINARKKAQYHQSAKSTQPRVVKPKAVIAKPIQTKKVTRATHSTIEREIIIESVAVTSAGKARCEARRKIEEMRLEKELAAEFDLL